MLVKNEQLTLTEFHMEKTNCMTKFISNSKGYQIELLYKVLLVLRMLLIHTIVYTCNDMI